jgi:hypothetical protein
MIHLYELFVIDEKVERTDLGIVYLGGEKIIFIAHNPIHPVVKDIEKLNEKGTLSMRSGGEKTGNLMSEPQIKNVVPIKDADVDVLNENLEGDYFAEGIPLTKQRKDEITNDVFDSGLWFKLVFAGKKALVRANRAFGRMNLEEFGRFFGAHIGGFDSVTVSSPAVVLTKEGVVMPNDAIAIILNDNRIIINGKQRSKEKRGSRDIGIMSALGIKIWRLLHPELKIPFKKLKLDKSLTDEEEFGYQFAVWYAGDDSTGEKGIGYAKAFRRLFWEILAGEEEEK